jgi:hypothetical protein
MAHSIAFSLINSGLFGAESCTYNHSSERMMIMSISIYATILSNLFLVANRLVSFLIDFWIISDL